MILRRLSAVLALALSTAAYAQTVTITAPNTVNGSGQPTTVGKTFIYNADGSIASLSAALGGAVPDAPINGTVNTASTANFVNVAVQNGQNSAAVYLTGLTGSGATLTLTCTNDGVNYNQCFTLSGATGALTNTFTANGSFSLNTAGRKGFRLSVTTAGTGSVTVVGNLSVALRNVGVDAPLPPGSNLLGYTFAPTGFLYTATAAGTGYSSGDLLERTVVANPTTGAVVLVYWINRTTGSALATAPTAGSFSLAFATDATVNSLFKSGQIANLGSAGVGGSAANPLFANMTGPDTYATGSIDATTLNSVYTTTVPSGANTVAFRLSGLTASGATLTAESSNDQGTTWSNVYSTNGSTGVSSNTFTADGQFSINAAARTRIRLRVSTTGTGTISAASNYSNAQRAVVVENPVTALDSAAQDNETNTLTASSAAVMTAAVASSHVTTAGVIDMTGYGAMSLQITGNAGANFIVAEGSNDGGVTWSIIPVRGSTVSSTSYTSINFTSTTSGYQPQFIMGRMRFRISAFNSGTSSVAINLKRNAAPNSVEAYVPNNVSTRDDGVTDNETNTVTGSASGATFTAATGSAHIPTTGIIDTTGYGGIVVQITANAGSNCIAMDGSNDGGTTWTLGVPMRLTVLGSASTQQICNAAGFAAAPQVLFSKMRVRMNAFASGSTSVAVGLKRFQAPNSQESFVPNTVSTVNAVAAGTNGLITSAALGASASYTQAGFDMGASGIYPYAMYGCTYAPDQAGTGYIDASNDNATWTQVSTASAPAATSTDLNIRIRTRYYRCRFVNGTTAQTTFRVYASATAN